MWSLAAARLDPPSVRRDQAGELVEPGPTRLDGHDQLTVDRPREVDLEARGMQSANG
jgi:hypothetical protein